MNNLSKDQQRQREEKIGLLYDFIQINSDEILKLKWQIEDLEVDNAHKKEAIRRLESIVI